MGQHIAVDCYQAQVCYAGILFCLVGDDTSHSIAYAILCDNVLQIGNGHSRVAMCAFRTANGSMMASATHHPSTRLVMQMASSLRSFLQSNLASLIYHDQHRARRQTLTMRLILLRVTQAKLPVMLVGTQQRLLPATPRYPATAARETTRQTGSRTGHARVACAVGFRTFPLWARRVRSPGEGSSTSKLCRSMERSTFVART